MTAQKHNYLISNFELSCYIIRTRMPKINETAQRKHTQKKKKN